MIVPECTAEGYSLWNVDELDMFILEKLGQPLSINNLVEEIVKEIDPLELKYGLTDLISLVYGRIKIGFLHKTIVYVKESI